jgi:dihydrofolate synthase / folylpolyglutamate synthase
MPVDPSFEWLEASQGRGIVPGLGRMERLLDALNHPERLLRCLHVAGTNGKGSVCAFAESVLRASGLRTGLYTSPHLVRFTERIRINGEEVEGSLIKEGIGRLRAATAGWDEVEMPTYFELVTALAFDLFARADLDVIVLETGLGGRLDATNTAPKLACAVTPIGLDHTEWLGTTLGEIAREKAGIFRPAVPAVTAPQEPEALAVLSSEAARTGATLRVVWDPLPPGMSLGLAGPHQRGNAALALDLIRAGGFSPQQEAISRGLAGVSWPGRFQRLVHNGVELVLDGAHNPHAARQLLFAWREVFGDLRPVLVFGALADKDPEAMLGTLLPLASEVRLVPVSSPRSLDPAVIAGRISRMSPLFTGYSHPSPIVFGSLGEALEGISGGAPSPAPAVLVAGSLFLVGEALALVSGGRFAPRSQ